MFSTQCISGYCDPSINQCSSAIVWELETNGIWGKNCDFIGNDLYSQISVPDINSCLQLCQTTIKCTHVTFTEIGSTVSNECWLKENNVTQNDAIFSLNYSCGILNS